MVMHHKSVEPEYQIVRDACTAVGYAYLQQLCALELGVDSCAKLSRIGLCSRHQPLMQPIRSPGNYRQWPPHSA